MNGIDPVKLSLLAKSLGAQAQAGAQAASLAKAGPAADKFAQALKSAVVGADRLQTQAAELAKRFQAADPAVGLEQVMISLNNANVSFQGLVQTRNRLVQAYQDVMNMQV